MNWVSMQKMLSEAEIRIVGWELRHGTPAPGSWMQEAETLRRNVRVLFERAQPVLDLAFAVRAGMIHGAF